MPKSSLEQRPVSAVTRRAALRGMALGTLGLAGAALLGCSKRSTGGTATGGSQTSSSASATPSLDNGLAGLLLSNPVVQGQPMPGGTYSDAVTAQFVNNDMSVAVNVSIWHIIGGKSLEWDHQTGKLLPSVVQSWEMSDPLNAVLKLNPNVYIQNKAPWNGRQFTAEDEAWNIERNAGFYAQRLGIVPSLFARSTFFVNMTKAEAVDPLTVHVKFSAPNSGFFNAGLAHSRMQLMPREMDDIGYNDPLKMAGSGPYEVTEWPKGQRSTYKKSANYAKFRPNEPYFDVRNQLVIPDLASQQAAFASGQIQLYSPGPKDLALVRKLKPDANLYEWVGNVYSFVRPGFQKYLPFRDFRVRQAIHLSLDYAAIADQSYGPGWVYQASLNPTLPQAWRPEKVKTLPGWNPATKAQDRADAAKLLAAAGYPNGKGIDFKMLYYNPSGVTEYAQTFQGQLTSLYSDMKVGFDPAPDNATFGKRTNTADFDALVYGHDTTNDPMQACYSEYHTGGNRNEGQFSDPACDALLDKMVPELNQDALSQLVQDFQQKWVTDWHSNWGIPAGPTYYFVQANIGGVDKTMGPLYIADYGQLTMQSRWYYVSK